MDVASCGFKLTIFQQPGKALDVYDTLERVKKKKFYVIQIFAWTAQDL